MIDPTTLTDEALYVEIHTWEHQREHGENYCSAALRPLYQEAAQRWMDDHTPAATVNPPVIGRYSRAGTAVEENRDSRFSSVRGPVVRSWDA